MASIFQNQSETEKVLQANIEFDKFHPSSLYQLSQRVMHDQTYSHDVTGSYIDENGRKALSHNHIHWYKGCDVPKHDLIDN
jgi:hypothetical protein